MVTRTPPAPTLTPAGQRWVAKTARGLDILAVVFLVDIVLVWSFPAAPAGLLHVLDVISWLVWAAFAVDYFARLTLSRPKPVFVRTHKLDLLMVLLPMLRVLRVFLLLRKSLATVSTEKIAGSIVSIVVAVVFVAAFLEWRVEYDAAGATITTFRTALWWAVVTTTTVGYGDYSPVTPIGRGVAMILMIVGIGLIGTVSATIASFFVSREGPSNDDTTNDASADEPSDTREQVARSTPDAWQRELLDRLDALALEQRAIRDMLVPATTAPSDRPV